MHWGCPGGGGLIAVGLDSYINLNYKVMNYFGQRTGRQAFQRFVYISLYIFYRLTTFHKHFLQTDFLELLVDNFILVGQEIAQRNSF